MTYLTRNFNGQEIAFRSEDNFWNATAMCKVDAKKQIAFFLRLESTKQYINILAEDLGVPPESLVETRRGGTPQEQCTWIHEDLAIELAGWINPKFRLWVNRVAKKLIREKVVYLENELEGLKNALSDSEAMIEVREHQLSESRAESHYWQQEYTLFRHGSHPDCIEVGKYRDNCDD